MVTTRKINELKGIIYSGWKNGKIMNIMERYNLEECL